MTEIVQRWAHRVRIGGIETTILDGSGEHATARPVGTCRLMVALPAPHVVDGASVVVEAQKDGDWLSMPLFTGTVRLPDPSLTMSGAVASIDCVGPNHLMSFAFDEEVAFTGDLPGGEEEIIDAPLHLGTQTISWYADTTPAGTFHEETITPTTDTYFLRVTGKHHGTNSYDTSTGDLKTTSFSQIVVSQAGDEVNRINLPVSNERYGDELDYTNIANWDDFDVLIAGTFTVAGGDITLRFESGKKPGTNNRDEFEVRDVVVQTAGKNTIRQIGRGLKSKAGLATSQYRVNEIKALDGSVVKLGGNPYVDNGQIIVGERDDPLSFYTRILELFGFVDVDCGDGITRTLPLRGAPSGPAVASFVEGVSMVSIPRSRQDPRNIVNKVTVTGATVTDAKGRRSTYSYTTDPEDVVPNSAIPSATGIAVLPIPSNLLTSYTLCEQVGKIAEVNNTNADEIEWDTWPHALYPCQIVSITAPTVGFSGKAFLTSVRWAIGRSGYTMTLAAWRGVATPFSEQSDPDPSESAIVPTARQPRDLWLPYSPLAEVA